MHRTILMVAAALFLALGFTASASAAPATSAIALKSAADTVSPVETTTYYGYGYRRPWWHRRHYRPYGYYGYRPYPRWYGYRHHYRHRYGYGYW